MLCEASPALAPHASVARVHVVESQSRVWATACPLGGVPCRVVVRFNHNVSSERLMRHVDYSNRTSLKKNRVHNKSATLIPVSTIY